MDTDVNVCMVAFWWLIFPLIGLEFRQERYKTKTVGGHMSHSFTEAYPNITRWIEERGWIELGADEHSTSLVRCLDEGGMVWEGSDSQNSLDEALQALEKSLHEWL